ncbi:MAG: hypothetical protein WC781_01540 [Candidatus Pacearchaeota archaeon]|jgi:hypothetical protein
MKKEVIVVLGFIFLISAGAFAQTISDGAVSKEVSDYVSSFVEKGGIDSDKITDIQQVDQSSLPDDVQIKTIDENNVGIYEVNYTEGNKSENLFIVTYSANELPKLETAITKNIQYLTFGFSGESVKSRYLDSATGVQSSAERGYVMMRPGSITGISTSLGIKDGTGKLYIKVYKNGVDTGFSNMITSSDQKKIDFDTQSENVLTYVPGDVIAVYVENVGNVDWNNVITTVETTS